VHVVCEVDIAGDGASTGAGLAELVLLVPDRVAIRRLERGLTAGGKVRRKYSVSTGASEGVLSGDALLDIGRQLSLGEDLLRIDEASLRGRAGDARAAGQVLLGLDASCQGCKAQEEGGGECDHFVVETLRMMEDGDGKKRTKGRGRGREEELLFYLSQSGHLYRGDRMVVCSEVSGVHRC
jgi:hypothetical protein